MPYTSNGVPTKVSSALSRWKMICLVRTKSTIGLLSKKGRAAQGMLKWLFEVFHFSLANFGLKPDNRKKQHPSFSQYNQTSLPKNVFSQTRIIDLVYPSCKRHK